MKTLNCNISGLFHKGSIIKNQYLISKYGSEIISSQNFIHQDNYIQHGDVSVKQHCICVADTSLIITRALKLKVRERSLVRGALLHDYFLYDWHHPDNGIKWHGYKHSIIALNNASRDFVLDDVEKEIIKKHMWPLNLTLIPTKKEAWIVNIADTYCSIKETLHLTSGGKDRSIIKNFKQYNKSAV